MATLTATVGSSSITLTGGNPYSLLSAKGMGGVNVRRVTSQGPAQDGDSDNGYRLAPREIELEIGIKAATDALLDGYRDALTALFKPLPSTPILLRYTRDDAAIRQIDCYTVGNIKIDLVNDYRVGHYHKATIRLRAVEPAMYNPTPGTVTVTGTAGLASDWWLAGGAVGTAQVLMSGGTPAQSQAWSYAGTILSTESWTLAWRGAKPSDTTDSFAYGVDVSSSSTIAGTVDIFFGHDFSATGFTLSGWGANSEAMDAGTANYFHNYYGTESGDYGKQQIYKVSSGAAMSVIDTPSNPMSLQGALRKWRTTSAGGSAWSTAIALYALYQPKLSESQRAAVDNYMNGAGGGSVAQAITIPYDGDLPEYPTISIRGPITGAKITNGVTGDELDFGTVVIGAGTTYIINTNPAYKTVLQGTVNKRGELTSDSDLGSWAIVPAPIATGGTNTIAVTGTGTGTATQVSIVYYNRYVGI